MERANSTGGTESCVQRDGYPSTSGHAVNNCSQSKAGRQGMTWALIIMLCSRVCYPQYVELYPTKAACEAKVKPGGWAETIRSYCVPTTKGDAQ